MFLFLITSWRTHGKRWKACHFMSSLSMSKSWKNSTNKDVTYPEKCLFKIHLKKVTLKNRVIKKNNLILMCISNKKIYIYIHNMMWLCTMCLPTQPTLRSINGSYYMITISCGFFLGVSIKLRPTQNFTMFLGILYNFMTPGPRPLRMSTILVVLDLKKIPDFSLNQAPSTTWISRMASYLTAEQLPSGRLFNHLLIIW